MKLIEKFIIELTKEEAESLKKLLGTFSQSSRLALGLNQEMSEKMSELYDLLPYEDI